jgi:hypothetical protein
MCEFRYAGGPCLTALVGGAVQTKRSSGADPRALALGALAACRTQLVLLRPALLGLAGRGRHRLLAVLSIRASVKWNYHFPQTRPDLAIRPMPLATQFLP